MNTNLLHTYRIIKYFGFSRYIAFAMHLDIHYVYIHNKSNAFRKAKTSYNLERREYIIKIKLTEEVHTVSL